MQSTRQITRAMEMVAASALRKAQAQLSGSKAYMDGLDTVMQTIGFSTGRPIRNSVFVVIAGDRGLAGGFNSGILRFACNEMAGKDAIVLPIGKKAVNYFSARNYEIFSACKGDTRSAEDCFSQGQRLYYAYKAGEIDEIQIFYTQFVSVLTQRPTALRLLPLHSAQKKADILYEPDGAAVMDAWIPQYIGGMLYGALRESLAAEAAARRTAMNAATRNADEMIESLRLQYNRARQSTITQEITEIVAGS